MNLHFECQNYEELSGPDEAYSVMSESFLGESESDRSRTNWLLQLKYDGIWARVLIKRNRYEIYSKTGQLKKSGILEQPNLSPIDEVVLIGEFMFGSQWSTHPERAGKLFIFDCLVGEGRDLSRLPYKDRYRAAVSQTLQLGQPFNILPCYSISKLGEFWTSLEGQTEGFIIRRWSDTWDATLLKLKYEVEDDFVVTGFKEGQGRLVGMLGALELSQYENGQLKYIMDCGGGISDEYRKRWWLGREYSLGIVVQVKGKGRFNTGALRHPNFVRIRDDKLPTQCLLKRQSK